MGNVLFTKTYVANLALNTVGSHVTITDITTDTSAEGRAIQACYEMVRDEVLAEFPWSFALKRVALTNLLKVTASTWSTPTVYKVGDYVVNGTTYYTCLVAHTSGTFATDLAAGDWISATWAGSLAYIPGNYVVVTGTQYVCVVSHTSGSTFAADLALGYWVATTTPTVTDDNMTNVYYLPTDYIRIYMISDPSCTFKIESGYLLSDTDNLKMIYVWRNDTPSTYTSKFITALATRLAKQICFLLTEGTKKTELLQQQYQNDLEAAQAIDSTENTPVQVSQDEWMFARFVAGSDLIVRPGSQTWTPCWHHKDRTLWEQFQKLSMVR